MKITLEKFLTFVLLFCAFISCSSSDKLDPSDTDAVLKKSFDLPEVEISKYAVNEVDPHEKEIIQAPGPVDVTEATSVVKKGKEQKKTKILEKGESVKLLPDKPATAAKFIYPEDYPEILKEYDKKSKDVWALSKPIYIEGEKFHFDAKFVGILAGHVTIETKPMVRVNQKLAYHYYTKLVSAKYYSFIYDLNDYIDSYVAKDSFLPIKYTLIQRESKQSVDDLQVFDHEKRQTHSFYKRIKNGQEKNEKLTNYLPEYFQDSFSALMFARSLPMTIGKVYEFPVVTRGKVWLLKFSAQAKEKVKINGEYINAIKVNAETHFPGVLKKRGDIFFWYSDDDLRKLLKFNAKVKIGSVEGELKKYENPNIPNEKK
jgi:hypothetical protein